MTAKKTTAAVPAADEVSAAEAAILAAFADTTHTVPQNAVAASSGREVQWPRQVIANAMVTVYGPNKRTGNPGVGVLSVRLAAALRGVMAAQYLHAPRIGSFWTGDREVGIYDYEPRWFAVGAAREEMYAALAEYKESLLAASLVREEAWIVEETRRLTHDVGAGTRARYTKGAEASAEYSDNAHASARANKRAQLNPNITARMQARADAADAEAFGDESDLPES